MKTPILNDDESQFWTKCLSQFLNFYPWEKKDQPNTIYHYTSLFALPQILKNKSIWASSFRFLNDMKEGSYLIEKSIESAKNNVILSPEFRPENLPKKYISETFAACFSTEADDLNQWRAYADDGNGVAIGFDRKKIAEIASGIPFDFTGYKQIVMPRFDFYKVSYDLNDRISKFLDMSMRASVLAKEANTPHKRQIINLWHKAMSILLCATTKSEKFVSENEWRIIGVYENISFNIDEISEFEFIDNIKDRGQHNIKFRTSNNKIIPYYEVKFDQSAINEIILGPKNRYQFDSLADALKLNFQSLGYQQPHISLSELAYI